ncbi:MAG: hypothetical protein GX089_02760 [Fibrobacter sp.]|nr:hypothetical protein [Fibrobacter sp.]
MTESLNRNIKELLLEYPSLEQILSEFDIGCTTCNLGTCKFKDIVEIHNLSVEQEKELLKRCSAVIFPGQNAVIPAIERKEKQTNRTNLAPPIRELVIEHTVIKDFLASIPSLLESRSNHDLIAKGIDFIRNYADAFHHAKEEKILFGYFDSDSDIIKSFITEHETGREYVREARRSLEKDDWVSLEKNLTAYRDLLTEHIKKEDEILYPWMNRSLSDTQIGQLFSRFQDVNAEFSSVTGEYRAFVESVKKQD